MNDPSSTIFWTPPLFARGAHVVWSGEVGVVESEARWTQHGWAYDIRLGTGLRMPVAQSALSPAPVNLAAPARWRAPPVPVRPAPVPPPMGAA